MAERLFPPVLRTCPVVLPVPEKIYVVHRVDSLHSISARNFEIKLREAIMKAAKLPGFTAEASLGVARNEYQGIGHSAAPDGGIVLPQIVYGGGAGWAGGISHCFRTCKDGSCDDGYCCDAAGCRPVAFSEF